MSDEITSDDVRKGIEPKSDQLNADDLIGGPITVTITNARSGESVSQPWIIEIEGHRPYKPSSVNMRRVIATVFGRDPKKWIGQQMRLYRDPDALFKGEKVGGIRISHMSGLTEPRTFSLTIARGKKQTFTVYPFEPTAEDQAYIDEAKAEIAKADTLEVLKAIAFVLKDKPKAVRDAVRPAYESRKKEIGS